ncbi:restriction endonuclease subunit S [Acinetobacter beijerinckii]|uniref:restriction endonuclease subunit S n=1 Tax=Acinetobacter beijerinckii TaxID=262668 RepID=UPI0023DDDE47|nr:restriction endonuclease subunit S [Acinetobacter beijerinckii]MDF2418010.1 restriction endonuclease subunit S [Acinetobacter beijerinckii]
MSVPKLRFKEFDGKWSAQKYKDALTIKYGKDHKLLEDGDIPVYGTGGVMRYVNQYLYDGESILIGRKGTIDQPKYVNEKFWTVDTLFYSEIKQNIYPLFIYQHALQVNWLGLNEATGVPSLNTTSINNVDIYLPSKPEQTKIASFFSAVDEKISQLTQKHELLSQYKHGMMQKLFSQQIRFKADDGSEFGEWESKFIKDLDLYISDGNYGELYPTASQFISSGVPFIRANNIKNLKVINDDMRFIDENLHEILDSGHLKENDILITTRGDIGMLAFVEREHENSNINAQICLLRVVNPLSLNSKFLLHFLHSEFGQKQFKELQTGSALKQLPKKSLDKVVTFIPCLEEQTKIANFLSAIDQKIEVVAQQIEQAKTWKKGLLQQMFV